MTLSVRFLDAVLRIDCDSTTAQWLEEFFAPSFEFSRGAHESDFIPLRVALDETLHEAMRGEMAGRRLHSIPCFALDQRLVSLPGWTDGATTNVHDEKFNCFYQTVDSTVMVVGHPRDSSARQGLMRVVRELLTARVFDAATDIELHAAAFEREGQAYVIAGQKGAGKTTALMRCLKARGVIPIANDRLFLRLSNGTMQVHGIQTAWRLRPAARSLHPELGRGTPGVSHPLRSTLRELRALHVEHGSSGADQILRLSFAQLRHGLGLLASPGAPLKAIAVLDPRSPGQLRDMAADEVIEALRLCLYGRGSRGNEPTLFARTFTARNQPSNFAVADNRLIALLAGYVLPGEEAELHFPPCFGTEP